MVGELTASETDKVRDILRFLPMLKNSYALGQAVKTIKIRDADLIDTGIYAKLLGRSGGQRLIGGTASGEDLTLQSTSDASRGNIIVSDTMIPEANDGAALGTTSFQWSDLFLASGAVFNFNNGDIIATHSSGVLSFAGSAANLGFFGFGHPSPAVRVIIAGTDGASSTMTLQRSQGTATNPVFRFQKSRGTVLVPVVINTNDVLGAFDFRGYDGSNFGTGAAIGATCSGAVAANSIPADLTFSTTAVAGTSAIERLRITNDGRLYGTALHNNAGAVTGTTNQYIASGTYTPTLTNVANLDASTAYECQWVRVGNVVIVSGKVDIDPTAAATPTQLGISLPIASNLGALEDCSGAAAASAIAGQSAAIVGDAANNRAEMQWLSGDITNQPMYFTFVYTVI